MNSPVPARRRPERRLRWVSWEVVRVADSALVRTPCHAFVVSGGRMATEALCGRRWRERGIRVAKDPSVERCPNCDAVLRGHCSPAPVAPASPTEYEPRFGGIDDSE